MRRTHLLMLSFLSFLVGLGLARLRFDIPAWWIILSMTASAAFYFMNKRIFVLACATACLLAGLWRGQMYLHRLDAYQQIYKQNVTVSGIAMTDGTYSETKQLAFAISDLRILEPSQKDLVGEIAVEGFGVPAVFKGDVVRVEGKIYPTRGGKQGTMRFANIQVIDREDRLIEKVRHRFIAGVYTALPEPMASFALGLLVGQRSSLPKDVSDMLMMTGLTHIVAVSGYNLTVLVRAMQRLRAKKSRYQAAFLALSLVTIFVLLVGNSPSIIRASIVSVLSIIAWYYGRMIKPLLLILLTAALTGGINPVYIWSDIGWYLSFLAFFGVLIVAPQVAKRMTRNNRKPKLIALLLIETLSAQIMTTPIILYIFGRGSILGILANMLVVPFVPIAMLLSLIAGIAGMVAPSLSGFFAMPARLLLKYMLDVAGYFSQIPGVTFERTITLTQMLLLYGLLGFFVLIVWLKNRDKNDIIGEDSEEF